MHDIYYRDAAFQCCVLNKLGYKVRACNIVHINNQYERNGDLNINELFTVEDITTDAMLLRRDVEANIDEIREYIKQTQEPTDDIGEHCFLPTLVDSLGIAHAIFLHQTSSMWRAQELLQNSSAIEKVSCLSRT